MRYFVCVVVLWSFACSAWAWQVEEVSFDTCHLEARIAFSYTRDMVYDHDGYLWIATARGLYQYDGSKAYLHVYEPYDSLSLGNNIVQRLLVTRSGNLWVLTDKSIQYYNREFRSFHHVMTDYVDHYFDDLYRVSFTSIAELPDSSLLIGTKSGLLRYDTHDKSIMSIDSSVYIVDICPSSQDLFSFYVLSHDGIYVYDSRSNQVTLIDATDDIAYDDQRAPYQTILSYDYHLFFVIGRELFEYDLRDRTIKRTEIPAERNPVLARDAVMIDDRYIIISTANHGMYRYDAMVDTVGRYIDNGMYNQLAVDHTGRLTTILNTRLLVRSDRPVTNTISQGGSTIAINDLHINGEPGWEADLPTWGPWYMRDYERSISFAVALTSSLYPEDILYEYRIDNGPWLSCATDQRIQIDDLHAGIQEVTIRAKDGKETITAGPITINVARFFYEQWWFMTLVLATLVLLAYTLYSIQAARKAEALRFQSKLVEMELYALRSQMNPHFIFNTLNSIKNYVLTKSPDDAADYLSQFAKLMRRILHNSKASTLSLDQELEVLKLYIEMEQRRLSYSFDYRIDVDLAIDTRHFRVAPLILQPFVENAIWHGLMQKRGNRLLEIVFTKVADGIQCLIIDNGIGRQAAKDFAGGRSPDDKSFGIKITADRLAQLNRIYGVEASVQITDVHPSGTQVQIFFPHINPDL